MARVVASLDAAGLNDVIKWAEAEPRNTPQGAGNLGPFFANYSAPYSFSGGTTTLTPPNLVHVTDCTINYSVTLSFGVDLSKLIPPLCIPTICFGIPFLPQICIPGFCITWPAITVHLPTYSDHIVFSSDFTLSVHPGTKNNLPAWCLDIVIVGIPKLDLTLTAAGLLAAIGIAVAAAVSAVPLIGPVLGVAIAAVMALITLAAVLGFLGPLVTLFVRGLTFNLTCQEQTFQPEKGLTATITSLAAVVDATPNLVVTAQLTV